MIFEFEDEYNRRYEKEEEVSDQYIVLKSIPKLKNLIHLRLDSRFGLNHKLFSDSLKQITNNCQKLKSIKYSFDITSEDNSNLTQLLSPLKAFKRLNISFSDYTKKLDILAIFTIDTFKEFSNTTHLTLRLHYDFRGRPDIISHKILTNIDTNLPKLQYLHINGTLNSTAEEVTQLADILSRLSDLDTIGLTFKDEDVSKQFEEEVTQKCRKIRRIGFKSL